MTLHDMITITDSKLAVRTVTYDMSGSGTEPPKSPKQPYSPTKPAKQKKKK